MEASDHLESLSYMQAGMHHCSCMLSHCCCASEMSSTDVMCCRDDTNGFQLYQSDPSGNYGGWQATAIGANHQGAQNILKQDYKEDITLEEATNLIIKVLTLSLPPSHLITLPHCAQGHLLSTSWKLLCSVCGWHS